MRRSTPANDCVLVFEVPIKSADFYQVEIGSRGDLTYSKDELEDQNYLVELTLGDS